MVTHLGCVASCLLAFFWDRTGFVGGEEHSVGLFSTVFFLALVDCTSSVLFMPYMVRASRDNSFIVTFSS
jgi:riboflavin transporter 2